MRLWSIVLQLRDCSPWVGGWEGASDCAACPVPCHMMEGHPMFLTGMGHGTAFRLAQSWWWSPASYICHVGPWSGEDLWWMQATSPGNIKQKRRAGAEASFSFSVQQSNWTVREQKLISRMEVMALVLTGRMEEKHRANQGKGIKRQECNFFFQSIEWLEAF